MPVERVIQTDTRIVDLLSRARQKPLILQADDADEFALIALDDEVIDLLLERNPEFIAECKQIDQRMKRGDYLTHEQVLQALREGTPPIEE
jgi:hypothetical protein